MSIRNFFYSSYWFSQPVIANRWVFWVWLLMLLAILAGGVAALIVKKSTEEKVMARIWQRVGNLGISMGLAGLLFFFFRQQSAYFLGWRFWFLGWAIVLAAWGASILKYYLKRVPEIRVEQAARLQKEKYLPQSK